MTWMLACSARNLCADMAAYPHRAAAAAQGSTHVKPMTGLAAIRRRARFAPAIAADSSSP